MLIMENEAHWSRGGTRLRSRSSLPVSGERRRVHHAVAPTHLITEQTRVYLALAPTLHMTERRRVNANAR